VGWPDASFGWTSGPRFAYDYVTAHGAIRSREKRHGIEKSDQEPQERQEASKDFVSDHDPSLALKIHLRLRKVDLAPLVGLPSTRVGGPATPDAWP
jgi:hypothetical protein